MEGGELLVRRGEKLMDDVDDQQESTFLLPLPHTLPSLKQRLFHPPTL